LTGRNGWNGALIFLLLGAQKMDPNLPRGQENLSLFAEFKDLSLVLAGGLCATLGGLVGTSYQARKARQIKLAETVCAENKRFA
jgi:hypothetical protein